MRVGLVGLGRMGEGMSRRMMKAGIEVWGYRRDYEKACETYENGYIDGVTTSIQSLVQIVKSNSLQGETPGIFMMVVPAENVCLLYTSPSPRDLSTSRMPSSA